MKITFLLIQSIFYILSNSLLFFFITALVLKVFKITDSQLRVFVFLLAFIKPFFLIIKILSYENLKGFYKLPNIGITKIKSTDITQNITEVDALKIINIFIILFFIYFLIFTLIKSYQNISYFKKLKKKQIIFKCDDLKLIKIISKYSQMLDIKAPTIYFCENYNFKFFTFGIFRKNILINKNIFNLLTKSEKETVILHELSHLKRNDNILNILLLYFANFNFYNPITYFIYPIIKAEQEKDCDKFVVKYSCRPSKEIAKDILSLILKINKLTSEPDICCPKLSSAFSVSKSVNDIKINRRIKSLMGAKKDKIDACWQTKFFFYSFFIVLLFL